MIISVMELDAYIDSNYDVTRVSSKRMIFFLVTQLRSG